MQSVHCTAPFELTDDDVTIMKVRNEQCRVRGTSPGGTRGVSNKGLNHSRHGALTYCGTVGLTYWYD